jgi:hypothetical protein
MACAAWKKGKNILNACQVIVSDHIGASVSYLAKIGSLTDWNQKQIEHEIDKVLVSRCKPYPGGQVANVK